MTAWIGLVLAVHILVTVLLVLIVLIQGGENVDITAAFGGVSQAAFGPRGTVSTLAKATWVLGGIFMITSITLSVWAGRRGPAGGSVLQNSSSPKTAPASKPATPAVPAKK
ncbi:MAG TPA: preprotein translocase subunit SecG [Terriglobia bacterium]|nr:preprotein translocase subunit SecG [Terriglobia bacterium]